MPLQVVQEDGVVGRLKQGFELVAAPAQLFARLLPRGDVVDDGEEQRGVVHLDGRGADLHRARLARLQAMWEDELVLLAPLRVGPAGGHLVGGQVVDVLDVELLPLLVGVAVELRRGRVGVADRPALRINQEHGGAVALEHGPEAGLTLLKGLLGLLALGNVAGDGLHARNGSVLPHELHLLAHPELVPLGRHDGKLPARVRNLLFDLILVEAHQPLAMVGVHQGREVLAHQFVLRVSRHLRRHRVDVREAPVPVAAVDDVAGGLDEAAVGAFALLEAGIEAALLGDVAVLPQVAGRLVVEVDGHVVALHDAPVVQVEGFGGDRLAGRQDGVYPVDEPRWVGKEVLGGLGGRHAVGAGERLRGLRDLEQVAERLIGQQELAVFVFEQDGVLQVLNEGRELGTRSAKGLLGADAALDLVFELLVRAPAAEEGLFELDEDGIELTELTGRKGCVAPRVMELQEAEVAQAQGREGAAAGDPPRRQRREIRVGRVGGHRGIGPQALHESVIGGQGFRFDVR